MNIYLRELKANRKAIIIWVIVIIAFIAMSMQKYDAMVASSADGGAEMLKIINTMPKALQSLWGFTVIDITKPIGYFSVLFFYLALMAAIHAGMLGANIISKEERDKTAEFLMAKPVSRNVIMTSKILAVLTNVMIFNLTVILTSILMLKTYTSDPIVNQMILSMIGLFLTQVIFMCIGISTAAIYKRPKKASTITMAILLFTFFLAMITDLNEHLEIFSFLTPFKYYDAKQLLVVGSLNIGYVMLSSVIIIASLVIAYQKYNKRDLNI